MTSKEAAGFIRQVSVNCFGEFEQLRMWYNGIAKDFDEAVKMAVKALETWDKIFAEYESLTDQIVAEGDEKHATERIDAWCIDMLRSVISDYYARRIIEDANRKYV